MKYLKLCLAFGIGWLTLIAISFATNAIAQRGNTPQQSSIRDRIASLEILVGFLEDDARKGFLKKRVAAPFEVTDRTGRRIFYVSRDRDVEYHRDGKIVAEMSAMGGGGTFWALAANTNSRIALTGESLRATENDATRMELGRDPKKENYRLIFFSSDGMPISGIGETNDLGTAAAFVGDQSGNIKARIGLNQAGRGAVDVNGENSNLIARLTEGDSQGGYLLICGPNGCKPPMVDAGDDNGVGIVRAGPLFFAPGVGLTGAPGSVLIGKH
jgi:hypothetical protein